MRKFFIIKVSQSAASEYIFLNLQEIFFYKSVSKCSKGIKFFLYLPEIFFNKVSQSAASE